LKQKGYHHSPEDYKNGLTYSKEDFSGPKKRPLRIGKVLEKHNATDTVKKAYMNDPARSASNTSDNVVTISRHPYDVGGMSTDRGWRSCMTLPTNPNLSENKQKKGDDLGGEYAREYLPEDIKHGTHVAYLHHKNDKSISKPSARIALKPHKNDKGHTILRPSHNTYGTASKSFHHTVNEWAKKHFPATPGKYYSPNDNLYDDDDDEGVVEFGNHPTDLLKHNTHSDINGLIDEHGTVFPKDSIKYDEVEPYLKGISSDKHGSLMDHMLNRAPKKERDKFVKHPEFHKYMMKEGILPEETQMDMAHKGTDLDKFDIASYSKNKKVLQHLMKHPNSVISNRAAKSYIYGPHVTKSDVKHHHSVVRGHAIGRSYDIPVLDNIAKNHPNEGTRLLARHRLRDLGSR
jgi:hypothetical protein